jgi:endonuclease/exonuclease/phosphatase family metal-dependent hydrolase
MTFNVRVDTGSTDSNGWYTVASDSGGRRDRAVSLINGLLPDIMGTQEVMPNQMNDLNALLNGYSSYGQGRDGGNNGEHSAIFYRSARFTPLDHGDFWLSPTPDVPGTTFIGSGINYPRMATWMKLHDHHSQQTYFVINTHWSLDQSARNQSAALMRAKIEELSDGLPLIVTGDFNTANNSIAMQTLRGSGLPGFDLTNSYRAVFPTATINEATFHSFSGATIGTAVDHVLYSGDIFSPTGAAIVRTSFAGLYPSDHYPVTATFAVTVVPEPAAVWLAIAGAAVLMVIVIRSRGAAQPV